MKKLPKNSSWDCHRIFTPSKKVFDLDYCYENLELIKEKILEFTALEGIDPSNVEFQYGICFIHNYKWKRPFDGEVILKTINYKIPVEVWSREIEGILEVHSNGTYSFTSKDTKFYIGRHTFPKDGGFIHQTDFGTIEYSLIGERNDT